MSGTDPPLGALTWASAAERNRLLNLWRRAVFAIFGQQARCVRVACVLMGLFNTKSGYAFPTNEYLAEETGIAVNKVRETLGILESGGAIVRANVTNAATGQTQRVIYPATAIIPRPALGQGGGAPSRGKGGEPQQRGHQNLRRIPRIQSSQIALARAESERRQERRRHGDGGPTSAPEATPLPVAASEEGHPSREATRDDQRLSSTAQDAGALAIERATGDRPRDAVGGMAIDGADDPNGRKHTLEDEEEGSWTL